MKKYRIKVGNWYYVCDSNNNNEKEIAIKLTDLKEYASMFSLDEAEHIKAINGWEIEKVEG